MIGGRWAGTWMRGQEGGVGVVVALAYQGKQDNAMVSVDFLFYPSAVSFLAGALSSIDGDGSSKSVNGA